MTIASLSEVLQEAKKNNYAVAGLVVLGGRMQDVMQKQPKSSRCL